MLFVRDFLKDQVVLRSSSADTAPLVSVILPTYGRCEGGFLERSISSILSQEFTNFELLIMDDGSTDGSYDLIEEFRKKDPRVVHVRHECNSGLPALRVNEGIELAHGQYIAFQFDDDSWRPNALKALVSEATCHSEPVVVVGHCRYREKEHEWVLPEVDLNLVNLYQQNRFANNSVLFQRNLVELYGMYDCHIGMRRLCDWDLWLRYMKNVAFVAIDDTISDISAGNPNSIGLTVPWDLALFRYLHDIPRNHLLTPEKWHAYQVDTLRVGQVDVTMDFRRRLYEDHIVPFYLKFRHHFPSIEGFSPHLQPGTKSVLCTKGWYDVSYDIGLNHYDSLSNHRGNYKAYFQPVTQISSNWVEEADALLLVRAVEDQGTQLAEMGLSKGKPLGYYLDDDLLTFHEFGREFDYLAPGSPCHHNLCEMLSRADAVWVTNGFIEKSVSAFNPRIIPHNGSVPLDSLPTEIRPRDPLRAVRIGYVGSGYRLEEFKHIWEALLRLSDEYGNQLIFEFWGLDVSSLPPLDSPILQKPFTFSYNRYLKELKEANFDIILSPLLDYPRPRLGKVPSKYYQTAVAGALGIFSDVPQYEGLPAGLTCLKAKNTAEAWFAALKEAVTMPPNQFDLIRQRMLVHVKESFTERAQIHLHEAAWRATEFHAKTRSLRHSDGRPRVLYVLHSPYFGGGEMQLWRRLRLARKYGIEPIVVLPKIICKTEEARRIRDVTARENMQLEFAEYTCFTEPRSPADYRSETERKDIEELIERCKPALVHTVIFNPSFGQVCAEMNIPHVATLHQVDDRLAWADGKTDFTHASLIHSDSLRYAKRWSRLLNIEKVCTWGVVPEGMFALGQTRHLESMGGTVAERDDRCVHLSLTGTLQERKRQLETIEAIGRLCHEGWECQLDLYGYTHFFPEYLERCKKLLHIYQLENRVIFHGFTDDVLKILRTTDVMLSLSTDESFPGAIAEAMAAGVLVVATPVGGIPELINDGVSGILCAGTSVEAVVDGIRRALALTPEDRKRITEQARRVARSEFHPHRTASDMLAMYNRAIDLTSAMRPLDSQPSQQSLISQATPRYVIIESSPNAPASQIRIGKGITYRIKPQQPNWIGLNILIGTRQRSASGRMTLRVLTSTRHLVREVMVDLSLARDNDWLEFRFFPIANSSSIPFILEFRITDAGPRTLICFYENNLLENKFRRMLRRAGLPLFGNQLHCRMCYVK